MTFAIVVFRVTNDGLLDVNVLFALLHPGHLHSRIAQDWLDRQLEPSSILICRVVQMGALRLLTMPSVMREDVKSSREFWAGWEEVMRDERFEFVEEPLSFEVVWKSICVQLPRGSTGNTDTYLAAFTQSGGHTLVTFDSGFRRFQRLSVELLHP